MPSLLISEDEFHMFSAELRSELLKKLTVAVPSTEVADSTGTLGEVADEDEPPDLPLSLVKELSSSCNRRTNDVLRLIAKHPQSGFWLPDLEKELDAGDAGLKGSWTGITKVCRRVLKDDDAKVISWTWSPEKQGYYGRVSKNTYRALRIFYQISA